MKKYSFKIVIGTVVMLFLIVSCTKDLDTVPQDKDVVLADELFKDPAAYKQVLAKLYAGLAIGGQKGPDGLPDITGIDENFGQYLRQYWLAQEVTTDEAVIGWADGSLPDYHEQDWNENNEFNRALYDRILYQITSCNAFLRETTESKLNARGVTGDLLTNVNIYRSEARFLRALSYYHAIDLYGKFPFVTETDAVGFFYPEMDTRTALFDFVESELLAIEGELLVPRSNEYARADKAAAWTLLSKLYLNAQVYTGTDRYADCITYASKVIAAGYTLESDYQNLFLADNNSANGVIFPIAFDGLRTQTFGGTTFLIHAAIGGNMNPADFGVNGGWGGTRTTSALVNLFDNNDPRALFHSDGQELEIATISTFTDGYAVAKFKNVTKNGTAGSDDSGNFVDTDFPLFRLADVYLMYAEATLRGGGGSEATAIGYINELRTRANNFSSVSSIDLDFILDERARELFWEAHRRTDLIRFGKFSGGSYLWPWKGGVAGGVSTGTHLDLMPIPATDLNANPNLSQNDGY